MPSSTTLSDGSNSKGVSILFSFSGGAKYVLWKGRSLVERARVLRPFSRSV